MKIVEHQSETRPPWSISMKLAVLYFLSAFGLLVLSSAFLYWALANNLRKEDTAFLNDRLRILRGILLERSNYFEELEEDIKWERPAAGFLKHYARVLDQRGRVLTETSGISIPPSSFPVPAPVDQTLGNVGKLQSSGKSYLVLSARSRVGRSSEEQLIQLALDVSREEGLLRDYGKRLAFILIFGILLSSALAIVITRKGLEPVREIAESVQRITANRLHERILARSWPEELIVLARAFDGMLGRLEKSFSQLSQFSADLAHELRTPINNLMGEAEVALTKARSPEEYKQSLESSLEEYERLSKIIDSLLFLARAENTEIPLERSLFDPAKEIQAVKEFHEAWAAELGIDVTCVGSASLHADPILFRRVMTNLISNALQYTPEKGKVTIEVNPATDGSISISVRDTGVGIDPKDLPHIFNRFYRADPTRSRHPEGTGLGLAIVKSIMDLHHGSVSAGSQPGRGTVVTLTFPPA